MARKYKGLFKPINENKYVGNVNNIVYRSSWESLLFGYLDNHPHVLEWGSEEIIIKYLSPVDNKMHRYFPDVYVKLYDKETNSTRTLLIEVKPYKETIPPDPATKHNTKTGRTSTRYVRALKTYAVNKAKWEAATIYCKKLGWDFVIFTEYELGIKKRK